MHKDCYLPDGAWGAWTPWAECSELCGTGGTLHGSRECNDPEPVGTGLVCEGVHNGVKDCVDVPLCPGVYTYLRFWG